MKTKLIDELCELLGAKSAYELAKEFGLSTGTLNNLNSSKKNYPIVVFLLRLSLECLRELPKGKINKIVHSMSES